MSFFGWLSRRRGPSSLQAASRRPLRLEFLEDRTVPSVTNLTPTFDVSNASGPQSECGIAINPLNPLELVAVSNELSNLSRLATYFTRDGGATWTTSFIDTTVDGLPAAETRFDPNVAFDSHGRAYVLYSTGGGTPGSRLIVARSDDGGETYTQITEVTNDASDTVLHTATLTTRPNGATDDVVVIWARVGAGGEDIQAALSTDAGATFPTFNNQINDNAPERTFLPWISTDTNGNFQVTWEVNAGGGAGVFFHDVLDGANLADGVDNQVTTVQITDFGEPSSKLPAQPDRGVFSVGTIDVDRSGGTHHGRVYFSYTDRTSTATDDTNIFVRFSDDAGANWSAPIQVNDDATTNSQFLPRMAVDQVTGHVFVSWYDARDDVNNQLTHLYLTSSADGGATWAVNQRVTEEPSDESTADPGFGGGPAPEEEEGNPERDGNNYGEYAGLAVFGGVAHPVWTDAREANFVANLAEEIFASGADVTATGGAGADTYLIRLDATGSFLEVFENIPATDPPTYTALLSAVHAIFVNSLGGSDLLIVDYSNGDPIPVGGLRFDGGLELDTLQVIAPLVLTWDITGVGAGNILTRNISFLQTDNLVGGDNDDAFLFSGGSLAGTLDGGDGFNLILGDDLGRTFTVDGVDAGTISDVLPTGFVRIQNLYGGAGPDTFRFLPTGSIFGDIDGGLGHDRFDFATLDSQVITLAFLGSDGFTGFTEGLVPIAGVFFNMDEAIGSILGTGDRILGPDLPSSWVVNAVGGGRVTSGTATFDFTNCEFLNAGMQSDLFTITAGGAISGLVVGGGGADRLHALGGAGSDQMLLQPGLLTLDGRQTRFVGFEGLGLIGQGGNDRFTLQFATGNPVPVQGVLVAGGAGRDLLTVGATARADQLFLTVSLLRMNGARVNYQTLEQMDLFAGAGNDLFQALAPRYPGLALVRFLGATGNDTARLSPSTTTQFFIDGGLPERPSFPGDALFMVYAGAVIQRPVVLRNGGSAGIYSFTNRRPVQFVSIERGAGGLLDLQPPA